MSEKIETHEFNRDGLLIAEVNENGVCNEYTRDSIGLITSKKWAVGRPNQVNESTIFNATYKKPHVVFGEICIPILLTTRKDW